MINYLIDFWSPKSANLGSQNPPQWSQEGPSLVKNVILSKSKNPSKVWAPPAKMKVRGPKMSLLGHVYPSKMASKMISNFWSNFDRFWVDFESHLGSQNWQKCDPKMNKNQDGEKIGKKRKKEAMTTFDSRTLGLFLVPGGEFKRGG